MQKLMGLDLVRTFEYNSVLGQVDLSAPKRVLDIGTWRSPFSLFLASKGFDVTALDLDLEKLSMQQALAEKMEKKGLVDGKNIEFTSGDATKLGFKRNSFGLVFCISTIEHIEGKKGDTLAIREIARVLGKGGRAILSVPYQQKYEEGTWGVFFSRYYDKNSIMERIVKPSGLKLNRIEYLIGGKTARFYGFVYFRLPRLVRHAFGWLQHRLAKAYLKSDSACEGDAKVCFFVLEKP